MTRLRGASVSSPDVPPTSVGIDKPPLYQAKLPPNAPHIIAHNTINVSDPAKVLPWYRDERRRQFNILVRRYKNQLLYGCQNPDCHTPTCASFRRRVTEGPFRRYTELSARTIACYLASLDNAESGLCRNTPTVPSDFPSYDHLRQPKRRSRTAHTHDYENERPELAVDAPVRQTYLDNDGGPSHISANHENAQTSRHNIQGENEGLCSHENTSTQRMKDPKSFTQNLFDTLSLRMVEWLPLRRSPDTFDSGSTQTSRQSVTQSSKNESPHRQNSYHTDRQGSSRGRNATSTGFTGDNPRTPSSRSPGGQPVAVESKPLNQHVKRLSVTEVDHWRPSPRYNLEEKTRSELKPARKPSINTNSNTNGFISMPSPPALKHRPQKHRGKVGDVKNGHFPEQKKHRRVSWDGSKVLNDFQHADNQEPVEVLDAQPEQEFPHSNERETSNPLKRDSHLSVETVTHLSSEIIDGLSQMLIQSDEDARNWKQEISCIELTGGFDDSEWRFATSRQRHVFTFIAQTVFYVFSSTKQVLRSFRQDTTDLNASKQNAADPRPDLERLESSLRQLFNICPWDIALHSLWSALEKLFVPPRELSESAKSRRRSSRTSTISSSASTPIIMRRTCDSVGGEHISDANAAYIATIAFFTLVGSLPKVDAQTWRGMLQMRAGGIVASDADMRKLPPASAQLIVEATDRLEHELALRLVNRLVRAITARLAFHEISKARQIYTHDLPKQRKNSVLDMILDNLSEHHSLTTAHFKDNPAPFGQSPGAATIIVEWLRTLFLREWDGKPEMARSSATGGVVQILACMYRERNRLGLVPEDFQTSFLSERLDPMEMPVDWLGRLPNNKTIHLLSYSFLFPPSALVTYFRALNYTAMSRYYEAAMTTTRHVTQTAFNAIPIQDDVHLLARMKTSMTAYLVLVVRRDNVIRDALDQLWRREKRELMRPLKVQMGMEEGEEGVDHGGVQQEFFRVVMAEALDPQYGMFTLDARTRVSWFQPCALELLYKFELLGLLMSLAIYNGITLPVNFPVALYRKLLGLKVKHLDHIRDGWPELARGLGDLLTWEDGDVGDIFMRTYEFSFEAFGSIKTVDMRRVGRDAVWPLSEIESTTTWPELPHHNNKATLSPPSSMVAEPSESLFGQKDMDNATSCQSSTSPAEEASLVNNNNRHQFVKDYIFWLTDKSIRPQYEAFARGFYTCLDRSALSIFTPEALKTVVEGIQEIDIEELERHARYEGGFNSSHRTIRDFWSIAKRFSPEKKAQLLEFVTASDRVPVNGIASIMFVIQKNGVGDARLPTSLTCFGRLLLPEYSSKAVLEEKLNKALENARGFGVA